jgi:hypothetical protein
LVAVDLFERVDANETHEVKFITAVVRFAGQVV